MLLWAGKPGRFAALEQMKTFALYWDQEGTDLKIRARQFDWNPDDTDDLAFAVSVIHDSVTAEGWTQLAEEFLGRFDR